ncbi:MAG: OmpP1/FadL family transporter, partial [Deferrisomatales bacterium]
MGNGIPRGRRGPALCLALVLWAAAPAWSAGFGIFTQGASALGQGNAAVAHGDDPSAVYFNPALLHRLPGTQIQLGTTLIAPVREFESASGGTTRGDADLFFPSTVYLTHRLHETLAVGFGALSPFGLGTAWPGDWEGRTLATRSEVTTFQLNPVVCLRASPGLSVALGLDALYLDASLKRKVNTAALGTALGVPGAAELPDAGQEFSGDGWGLGFNAGLHADLTARLALGLTYRGAIRVKAEGRIR